MAHSGLERPKSCSKLKKKHFAFLISYAEIDNKDVSALRRGKIWGNYEILGSALKRYCIALFKTNQKNNFRCKF